MNRAGMLIALAAVAMFVTAPGAQTRAEVALRAAVELETVKGDLRGAIEAYKKIADDMKVERVVRAQALLRLAAAYQKLGDAQARTVYERIVRDFPEQQSAVAAARAGLAPVAKRRTVIS